MKDEYFILLRNGFYYYYKNKELHREAGPAFFAEEYKDDYFYLDDKNIYKINDGKKEIITNLVLEIIGMPSYFLNGVGYEKEKFEKIVLSNQLNKELTNNNKNKKKLKI